MLKIQKYSFLVYHYNFFKNLAFVDSSKAYLFFLPFCFVNIYFGSQEKKIAAKIRRKNFISINNERISLKNVQNRFLEFLYRKIYLHF